MKGFGHIDIKLSSNQLNLDRFLPKAPKSSETAEKANDKERLLVSQSRAMCSTSKQEVLNIDGQLADLKEIEILQKLRANVSVDLKDFSYNVLVEQFKPSFTYRNLKADILGIGDECVRREYQLGGKFRSIRDRPKYRSDLNIKAIKFKDAVETQCYANTVLELVLAGQSQGPEQLTI